MSKFLLNRIEMMIQNWGWVNVTPGLEAALYLHWSTLYDSDPKKYECLKDSLPEARRHLAEYLALTEQEAAAHLELRAATAKGGDGAVGTRDFEAEHDVEAPGSVEMVNAQFGLNWVFLYWDEPKSGGTPWGYRIYRRDDDGKSELVATVTETEALLPAQPTQVKWYYSAIGFNGAGESKKGPDFGLMLDAPEEE